MIKIYDTSKTFIKNLSAYKDLSIESVLENGDKTLSFTYLGKQTDILNEYYIETEEDQYVVKEVKPRKQGTGYVCKLNLEELEASIVPTFTASDATASQAAALALVGTGWLVESSLDKQRNVQQFKKTPLELLYKIRDAFMCEIWFDTRNKVVHFEEQIGEDKGVYFRRELNLKSLDVTLDSYDYYTRILPYGKDGLEIQNGTKNYVENYQFSTKVRTLVWEDSSYEDADALKEDAIRRLEDLSRPKRSYSADVRDLARISGTYSILEYSLGDTIHLTDEPTGVMDKQRIVKMTVYPDDPYKNKIELSNTTLSFEDLQSKLKAAADAWQVVSEPNGTINGVYVHGVQSGDVVGIETTISNNSTVQGLVSTTTQQGQSLASLTLTVGEINTTYLRATDAELRYATIENLSATNANVQNLSADYGDFKTLTTNELNAQSGYIGTLNTDVANIQTLLSGSVSAGAVQTIVLNAQNSTIDTQFLRNLVVQNVTASDIIGQRISTTQFLVGSDSGKLTIDDNTLQIRDGSNHVRIQIGEDGSGDYSFIVYNAAGTGQLLNANGITASGIPDGLIKNAKIAGDANISASKLDIASLFSEMNGSQYTLKSNRIYLDESGQSLNVAFSQMSGDVSGAVSTANAANETAQSALAVIQGISTLDALSASLTNDAHVVHTNTDGSGGDYTNAKTTVMVYLGDTDVNHDTVIMVSKSTGITGSWNANTYTYQVTGMSTDDGYVDFDCVYGSGERYLVSRSGFKYTTRSGKYLTIRCGGARIAKRFSISKAPDGRVGVSYDLQLSSVVMTREAGENTVTFTPATITARAVENDNGVLSNYAGIFVIEESANGSTWTETYHSNTPESVKEYTPSGGASLKQIRITLKDATNTYTYDYQTVAVVLDADALSNEVDGLASTVSTQGQAIRAAQQGITTHTTKIGQMENSINGLQETVGSMTTKIDGVIGGNLQYQITWEPGTTQTILAAHVYEIDPDTKKQTEITERYPARFFTWSRRSEDDEYVNLGFGKTKTVNNADFGFNGNVDGWFYPYSTANLTTRSGNKLTTRSGKYLTTYVY